MKVAVLNLIIYVHWLPSQKLRKLNGFPIYYHIIRIPRQRLCKTILLKFTGFIRVVKDISMIFCYIQTNILLHKLDYE